MPQGYFVTRPQPVRAVQWTGDNFEEVSQFVDTNARPLVDQGDGTLMTGGGYYPEIPVETGGWVDVWGNPFGTEGSQQVPGPVVNYVFEE